MAITYLICVLAVFLDRLVGDPKKWTHPVIYIGCVITFLEKRLNVGRFRKLKGLMTVILVVGGTGIIVFAVVQLALKLHFVIWIIVEVALISLALAQKSLQQAAERVATALEKQDFAEARDKLSWIVGRDTTHLDEPEIVRGVIETVSENTSDGVTAPLFYALLFGATGAWCYKAINTLDSMIAYKNERYMDFGYAAAKLDDVANYIPSRITGFIILMGTTNEMGQNFRARFKHWLIDAKKHPSPNSGYLEAATAWQLGIRLGGYNRYGQVESFRAYMGEPFNVMKKVHIEKAVAHMYACTLYFLGLGGIIYAVTCAWG
ncbi:MAG: adenosylcobinamide-phosphate synthase CbiB [Solibacillus sp.]